MTSIEWLKEKYINQNCSLTIIDFDKAKQLHKQEILDAFTEGAVKSLGKNIQTGAFKQHHYSTMPLAILEVVKIFMATVAHPPVTTMGELFMLCIRFQGLCLLGLLIDVMGGFMRRMLFGHSK
jgi:hypothetical protein